MTKPDSLSAKEAIQEVKILTGTVRDLKKALREADERTLSAEVVRRHIFQIAQAPVSPPAWALSPQRKSGSGPGVPTLLLSDWHWGEVVDPAQVGGVNAFNMKIGHQRVKLLIEHTIDLLTNHMVNPNYPGIVVILGGDLVSGDIHEELSETNEKPIMSVVIDLFGVLINVLSAFADQFHHIFIPAITGNHGRTTKKPRHKNRVYTSYDWLLYQLLAKYFEHDKRFTFLISDDSDVYFRIFNHRYLGSHGDQFRGGDGMVGALGPIIRGDHKKRSRNMEIEQPYDTLVCGHWHQLIQLRRVIVNSSLKGYCEFAHRNNFPFEPPQQALWITHPQWGITMSLPVLLSQKEKKIKTDWVSINK